MRKPIDKRAWKAAQECAEYPGDVTSSYEIIDAVIAEAVAEERAAWEWALESSHLLRPAAIELVSDAMRTRLEQIRAREEKAAAAKNAPTSRRG